MNLIGKVLANRYEILEEIGSGGMAVVYKARCQLLNRFVAVKVLRPDLQNDEEFVRRFNVEAQAAASLAHPNIVSIYDVGNEDGLHYIVMEYIEGKTLKEYIDEKHVLPWREAVEYAIQIGRGLEQAHKNSIIHRDIKPHNIIMTKDGVLKVTDFGIARANVQSTMTCDDSAIGSVHYISPEQARGGYTDERSDIYSLGIVLYEMLTGVVPFDNESPVTVAIKHIQEKPVPPREHNISIPLPLEKVVLKAIAKELSARYKNVTEFIDDLQSILDDPAREVRTEPEDGTEDIDRTIKMPAVESGKRGIITENESESEVENVRHDKRKPKRSAAIDKKKEKKVIISAVVCAIAVILVIAFAFISITGIGGMFGDSQDIEIPKLTGMLYDDAAEKYKDAGFSIVKEDKEVESSKEEGTILEQSPEAGSKIKKKDGIVIKVTLSSGSSKITLLNYTRYKDAREVELKVENLGLKPEFIEEYSDTFPNGSIISQEPSAGTKLSKGDTVIFYVSKGPENKKDEKTGTDNPDENGTENGSTNTGGGNTGGNTTTTAPNTPTAGQGTTGQPQHGTAATAPKKSTMLTLYGPKDKESALVQVNVNGSTVYSKKLAKDQSDVVKLEGTTSTVEVEILYDGVSQQKSTVKLH